MPTTQPPLAGQPRRCPRVLIVDDDAATRLGLSELLDSAGYEAIPVDCFELARHILRSAVPPDALITDVRLGDYNGLQLLFDSPVPVPTIVISGFPDPVLQSDAEHYGATYLVKPVSPSLVLELLRARTAPQEAERQEAGQNRPGTQ